MLPELNLKSVLRALCTAILMCGVISPITTFANDSDGYVVYPNIFDVEVSSAGMTDLNVYSRGHDYTDLDLYYDFSVGATIRATLGRTTRARFLGVSVRPSSHGDTGSYQPSTSFELPAYNFPDYSDKNHLFHTRSVFNHRVLAAFAINACKQNIARYLSLNPDTSKDSLFARDFTLPFKMDYALKLHGAPSTDTSNESNENYEQLVRTGRNIICHKNTVDSKIIKRLGTIPKLQIPDAQFPGSAPIARPDAPDARLHQNSNMPTVKRQKPTIGIKQPLLNNRPVLKPAVNSPVLKPVLEKKKRPDLNNVN